jgi:hypothetical protein
MEISRCKAPCKICHFRKENTVNFGFPENRAKGITNHVAIQHWRPITAVIL